MDPFMKAQEIDDNYKVINDARTKSYKIDDKKLAQIETMSRRMFFSLNRSRAVNETLIAKFRDSFAEEDRMIYSALLIILRDRYCIQLRATQLLTDEPQKFNFTTHRTERLREAVTSLLEKEAIEVVDQQHTDWSQQTVDKEGTTPVLPLTTSGAPVTQTVELLVKCSPRLDETVSNQLKYASRQGGDVNVSVSVLAYPLPTLTWSRSNTISQNLTGSSIPVSDISVTARLHLANLQEQDFGDYSLAVDNGVGGFGAWTLSIVSEGPPSTPTNVSVSPEGPFTLHVSWKEEFNGGANQTFTVEYSTDKKDWKTAGSHTETGSGNYMTSPINDLNSDTLYYVRIVARNKFGNSSYTEHVTGRTEKKVIPAPGPPAGLIGGVAGGVAGVLILVVIVVVVMIVRRRGKRGEDTERITSKRQGKGYKRQTRNEE
ncbi:titin-like [Haliotis rubra]|uniref:titin-like n=1 Tax=Haliotis rubra TaxID=36100 RepID=UPI001EE5141B|nr:titin-like [Haliotis rubra]